MVLCKFFEQGSCRFGSKCNNEHVDVKHQVKIDVEAAINGKQWPLSTYGPFRDKPSIPNFIEDQSFEEVRMLCYEAKQKNFFDQFHQQFNKEALEASNKMKALLQMTPDIVDVIINVYNTASDTSSSGVTAPKTTNKLNNPFGLANCPSTNTGSIFAKTSANSGTNNIFSIANSANSQSTPGVFSNTGQPTFFASSTQKQQPTTTAGGIFSQQNQFLQQPQQNQNIFQQASQASQPQQGLFAQASQTIQQQQIQQQQGIFAQSGPQNIVGQGLFSQVAQQPQNIYAQALQQQQQTNSNIFPQNLTNTGAPQQQPNTNIFQHNPNIAAQQQSQQPPSDLFQQAALCTENSVNQMNQLTPVNSSVYSRLEELTADELNAFKADYFQPGKIPFNPPPRELIN